MKVANESVTSFVIKAIFIVFFLAMFIWLFGSYDVMLLGTVLVSGLFIYGCYKFNIPYFPVALFLIAFIIRLSITLTIDTPIESDFLLQYNASQQFASGDMSFNSSSYFQTWGYQTGMVIYQGILLKIWNSIYFLKIMNCLWSAGTVVLVYFMAKEFFDVKAAQCTSLLYTIFVFHATFVTVLNNSIPSAFFLYLSLYLFISKRMQKLRFVWRYVLSALCLAISNFFRPDAVLVLVAVFAYFLFAFFKKFSKQNFIHYGKRFLLFFVCYFVVTTVFSQAVSLSGVNPAGMANNDPLWKFVLGTNSETSGCYSYEDPLLIEQIMDEQGISRDEAELSIIKSRLSVPVSELIELASKKVHIFWWENPLYWSIGHLSQVYPNTYSLVLDFNSATILVCTVLAFLGCIVLYRRHRNNLKAYLLPFLIFATFCVYLIVEVQPRYAYTTQIALFILAAGGFQCIAHLWRLIKDRYQSSQKTKSNT